MRKWNRSVSARVLLTVALATVGTAIAGGTARALPSTTTPTFTLNRTIRTTPFVGTTSSMRDNEGSAFVPNNAAHPNLGGTDSLWLVEDNGRAAWEIDPATGTLKSAVRDATWQATKQYDPATDSGTGPPAGSLRDPDIEAAAYDASTDTLYVFNGKCCTSSVQPTVFRLKRGADHTFHPESWQPLPAGSDYTAADWNARDNKIYVGVGSAIRTYDYRTNVSGPTFSISGVSGIYGMGFSTDGTELYVANKKVHVLRVDWVNRKLMTGWDIDLTPFGMKDSRSVEVIHDQFYVGDGYDGRATGDPLRYAVFVFDVCCGSTPAPVASFTSTQAATPDLTVDFNDTSTNTPTSWAWDFDHNGTVDSTAQNPQHTFPAAGDYAVTLTATNGGGSGSVTQTVHVDAPGAVTPTANFTFAPGTATHSVQFTDTSTGAPTSWSWTFGDGATSTQQSPLHTYPAAGAYPVTLTATNTQGSTSVTKSVTVSDPGGTTTFTPTDDGYVSWSSPTKNYATYTDLKVLANTGTYEYHPYFQFSLSGLTGAPTSAKLRLYVTDGGSSGANWFTTATGWTEGTLTWNNAPAITGSPFASVAGAVTAGQWIEIDVTSRITGNGTFSFAATTGATDTVAFASKESAHPPQLVVTG